MTANDASGDGQWIRVAVSRFEGPLTRYAHRFVGDVERARDIVQDTFLRLCGQKRDQIQDRLAEWLFTVCRNRALDVLRKENRMARLTDSQVEQRQSAEPDPTEMIERHETASQIVSLLESLPPNQREVIRLKFQNGFSYREISRITGHSVTNVGFLIHTGLKNLRTRLCDRQPSQARV